LTISFGVAVYQGGNLQIAEELLQAADHAMYEAKAGGKDRIVLDVANQESRKERVWRFLSLSSGMTLGERKSE
jgi:predicted signal transduction protein with EAL and GGDEF domain